MKGSEQWNAVQSWADDDSGLYLFYIPFNIKSLQDNGKVIRRLWVMKHRTSECHSYMAPLHNLAKVLLLGLFVCVEVLRPNQTNGVMSSAVSLPNHTFTGQAWSSTRLTSVVHILSPETDNCPSWISGRERMTVENISWSISTKDWLSWGLTTRQPLWVILCRLPEKGRKETEEIAEEMKERDREERGTGMKVKKQKK